jgi:cell division protease FtsH
MKSIIDSAYERTQEILQAHIDKLRAVAAYLLENEKMSGEEFEKFFTEPAPPAFPQPAPSC